MGSDKSKGKHKEFRISLVELLEDGLILEIPPKSCSVGHILNIEIKVEGRGHEGTYHFSTIVKEMKETELFNQSVTLSLLKPDPNQWEAFNSIFLGRQDQIDQFLDAAKG